MFKKFRKWINDKRYYFALIGLQHTLSQIPGEYYRTYGKPVDPEVMAKFAQDELWKLKVKYNKEGE